MRRTVIVGAGVAGLATALLLARNGREVLVLERDPAPVPAADDELWGWPRPGTPQARLGHVFFPGFRTLLAERAPDVLEAAWAAGAVPVDFAADLPGERVPADAEFIGIMARRCLLEGCCAGRSRRSRPSPCAPAAPPQGWWPSRASRRP
jgi:hypothetical protein